LTGSQKKRRESYGHGRIVAAGARVVLRYPRWSDEDELLALRRASWDFIGRWQADLPGVDPFGHSFFVRYMRFGPGLGRLRFLIRARRSGRILGSITLAEIDHTHRRASLGYWIGARFARLGYMSQALTLLRERVCAALDLAILEAYVLPENTASKRMLAKLGFERVGVARQYRSLRGQPRDHERWISQR